jgi:thiol-disulfide isomerase/thioredoxin
MNIGPLVLPLGVVLFFASAGAAVVAGRLIARGRADTESAIFVSALVGLAAARLSFVLHYLPSYHGNLLKLFDIRDIGFDWLPGVAAASLAALWMMVRNRPLRVPLAAAALVGALVWTAGGAASGHWRDLAPAPTLALRGPDGKIQTLTRHDGRPLVINFWATWCAPCQAEMPILANAQANDERIDLVFVNQGEPPATVSRFLQRLDLHLANALFDPQLEVAKSAAVRGYPTTLFYDASGRLIYTHVGLFSEATLDATLDRLYPPATSAPQVGKAS